MDRDRTQGHSSSSRSSRLLPNPPLTLPIPEPPHHHHQRTTTTNASPPDDFYRLYALAQQATSGDNAAERPVWAERGGLDFEGRARWDAWSAVKGVEAGAARLRFVKLFHELPASALYLDTRGELLGQ